MIDFVENSLASTLEWKKFNSGEKSFPGGHMFLGNFITNDAGNLMDILPAPNCKEWVLVLDSLLNKSPKSSIPHENDGAGLSSWRTIYYCLAKTGTPVDKV